MTKRDGPVQHIGSPQGRIAIWCDETQALDLVSHYPYPDKFGDELVRAIERAYPNSACTTGDKTGDVCADPACPAHGESEHNLMTEAEFLND